MSDPASASSFAVNSILERIDSFIREIPGVVTNSDPECLHRARVASRRLAMSLRLNGRATVLAEGRAFSRLVRSRTRLLGEARDLDVQMEWLAGFAEGCGAKERPGVQRVMLRLAQKRAKIQPRIARSVADFTENAIARRVAEDLRRQRIDLEMRAIPAGRGDLERTARLMSLQIEEIIRLSSFIPLPDSHDAHHRLRIWMKRLRYSLEMTSGLFGDAAGSCITLAKKAQDLLGELHDANVWVGAIEGMARRERERTAKYYGSPRPFSRLAHGYRAIAADRASFRSEQYDLAVRFWDESGAEGELWDLRARLLDACRGVPPIAE
jgi:CHAD domain-containing protein